MPVGPDVLRLRRCALAVAVLHDVDLMPATGGIVLTGPDVAVDWAECRRALAGHDPESVAGRQRLADWLLLRGAVAELRPAELAELARPYGAVVSSDRHPGLDWIRRQLPGDAIDLGFGFAGLGRSGAAPVVPVPHELLRAAGVNPEPWWPGALGYLERMGALAVERLVRDPRAPLRPMGGCDVVTLLGSRAFRQALAACADGMRTLAVPVRSRGWCDLSRVDPAFAAAAWRIADDADRGFPRPLLVTRDEVVLARDGGDVIRAAVEDPIGEVIDLRDALYR